MANVIISPNMSLPIPIAGVDPGPDWANNVNSCLTAIDGHNHTAGSGVQLTPAALNINANLPMNNNDLITARSVRFQPQVSPVNGAADLGCLYEQGVDLYYVDGAGNQVRITQGGVVTGASGTITGLPSGTASASFAANTFTFQAATNTPAAISGGALTIAQQIASGFGVTISASASQASNYGLTLPLALPGADASVIVSDMAGNLSYSPKYLQNEIVGVAGASTAPAGDVGEIVQSIVSGATAGAALTVLQLLTISLTAGDWDVSAMFRNDRVGTWPPGLCAAGIGLTSASFSGTIDGYSYCQFEAAGTNTMNSTFVSIPLVTMNLSGTTSVYLNYKVSYTGAPDFLFASITARRRR